MNVRSLVTALSVMSIVSLVLSCSGHQGTQVFPRKVSIAEAEKVLGVPIPTPHYAPPGYSLRSAALENQSAVSLSYGAKNQSDILLRINWDPEGFPPYRVDVSKPTVSLKVGLAALMEDGDKNRIAWNWIPDRYPDSLFVFQLSCPDTLPVSELILIADSVDW